MKNASAVGVTVESNECEMEVVYIDVETLKECKDAINELDPDRHKLYFHQCPSDVLGKRFMSEGKVYVITDVDSEDHEEPLLAAVQEGYEEYEISLDEMEVALNDTHIGYYTNECVGNFRSNFTSHTEACFSSGERNAWNVPGIGHRSIIGFYWIPLTAIMDILY